MNAESSGNNTKEKTAAPQWEFIDSGYQTARYNMDFDMMLVERCRNLNKSFLRVYRWKPYAISLGYNQNKAANELALNFNKCESDGIDIVQRPTGGRAVFHAEELTYSVAFRSKRPVRELYRDISMALMDGLKTLDPRLVELSFTKETPDLVKLMKTGMYNLCFNSQVKYEINRNGRKLVGSAQRKFGDVVLQHGSILIGTKHKDIINYLNVTGDERLRLKNEIDEKTISLAELTGRKFTYNQVSNAVFKGFEKGFNVKFAKINRLPNHFPGNHELTEKVMN